jgi:hypothetical protein
MLCNKVIIRKIQDGLELNASQQLSFSADDINLLGENI